MAEADVFQKVYEFELVPLIFHLLPFAGWTNH